MTTNGRRTDLPLSSVRVLAIEQYAAGPYCSMFLADMGADVIRIEHPGAGGDFARHTGPYLIGEADSLYFQCFNLNKRSITLDIKHPKGRAVLEKLVRQSDAITNNLRGSLPTRLGLDYAGLRPHQPNIVCGHISGYGRDNERANWPGYDYLMQAEAGFLSVTGEPGDGPTRFGLSIVDFMTGIMLAFGVVSAVLGVRAASNADPAGSHGRDVDVSLFDAALHQLTYPGIWYLNECHETGRNPRGAHPSVTPSQLQKTRDGWLFVMCQNPDFWDLLVKALNRPDIGHDPRFRDLPSRLEHRAALTEILDREFSTRTTAEWIELLKGKVPVGPVFGVGQALDNPFVEQVEMIQTLSHPLRGAMRTLRNPIKLDGQRLPSAVAPALGHDTDGILQEVGMSTKEIQSLRAEGVI